MWWLKEWVAESNLVVVVKRVGCSGFIELVAVTIKSGLQRGLDDLGIFGFGGDFWIIRIHLISRLE